MKGIFCLLIVCLLTTTTFSQSPSYTIHSLSLPPELSWYYNQFSGLYVHDGKLFLLSESRLQDKAEAKLYAVPLADLDKKRRDTNYVLPYKKYTLENLQALRAKMAVAGNSYEGLEAMVIDKNIVYLSVETATPSNNCYLVKGNLKDTSVLMDTTYLVALPKPAAADGSHIYNAGVEAITKISKKIYGFFEYNYFAKANYVYAYPISKKPKAARLAKLPIQRLPFRITDITAVSVNHFTAINYFFKGEGEDTVYRTQEKDAATRLIKDSSGYRNYVRLIDVFFNGKGFTWKPLLELPINYMSYNWEGIAAYKNGYFLMNDKYTPARPYTSTLLFLEVGK
jgi:hypothetical protein